MKNTQRDQGRWSIQIRRHNGQCPYGAWLAEGEEGNLYGAIPAYVYEDAIAEAAELGADGGQIISGGRMYEWRAV